MMSIIRRLFSGFSLGSPYLLAGVAVIAFGAGGWTVHKFVKAAEVKALEKRLEASQDALQGQITEANRLSDLLATREEIRAQAQREAAKWRRKWQQEQRNDKSCEDWANQPLPQCVIRMFKLPAGTTSESPPEKPDEAKPD